MLDILFDHLQAPSLSSLLALSRTIALWTGFVALGFLACGLPAELVTRAWVRRYGDPLDRSLPLLRPDARLGWRQRKGLRDTLYAHAVRTNELGLRDGPLAAASPNEQRILILGTSAAFGWGVDEDETYARRLARMLKVRFARQASAVINAGQIGYSSWQGFELYRTEFRDLKPNVVVIAYGINDSDRYRFFNGAPGTDRVVLARSSHRATAWLQTHLGRSYLFWRLQRATSRAIERATCMPLGLSNGLPTMRVPLEEYSKTIQALIDAARRDGARVVLMTSIYRRPSDATGEPPGSVLGASDRLYRSSMLLAAQGQCSQAHETFKEARQLEPRRIEENVREYNHALRDIARKRGLPLIDAEKLLSGADTRALFADPVHPSAQGHERIARALFETLVRQDLLYTIP